MADRRSLCGTMGSYTLPGKRLVYGVSPCSWTGGSCARGGERLPQARIEPFDITHTHTHAGTLESNYQRGIRVAVGHHISRTRHLRYRAASGNHDYRVDTLHHSLCFETMNPHTR